jgi:hypothetical protein
VRAFAGLVLYDATLLVVGAAVLSVAFPSLTLRRLRGLLGLAYWLGLATVGVGLTWLTALGIGPRVPVVLGVASVPVVAAAAVRLRRRREPPDSPPSPPLTLAACVGYGLVGLVIVGQFLASWNHPLSGWDSWAFWIPKARLLAASSHVSASALTQFSGTTYPPLVPLVHAGAFGFMGSANEVMLDLQAAVFLGTFVQAVVAVTRRLASDVYVVPFALVLATIPEVLTRSLQLDADYPTEFLFALGALLCIVFLKTRVAGYLVCACILLAACSNARREGLLYAAAVGVAGVVVFLLRERRGLLVAGAASVAGLTYAPWFLWIRIHHVQADSVPPPGLLGGAAGGGQSAASPLLHGIRVLGEYVFRAGLWGAAPYLGFLTILVALLAGRRLRIPVAFVGTVLVVSAAGMLWRLLWSGGLSNPEGTPIPRISGAWSLLLCAVAPVLLASVTEHPITDRLVPSVLRRSVFVRPPVPLAAGVVVLPAVVLAVALAPRVQASTAGCETPAPAAGPAIVVFGYPKRFSDAVVVRNSALRVGFKQTSVGFDHCGRLRVQSVELPSVQVAREVQAEAESVHLKTTIRGA